MKKQKFTMNYARFVYLEKPLSPEITSTAENFSTVALDQGKKVGQAYLIACEEMGKLYKLSKLQQMTDARMARINQIKLAFGDSMEHLKSQQTLHNKDAVKTAKNIADLKADAVAAVNQIKEIVNEYKETEKLRKECKEALKEQFNKEWTLSKVELMKKYTGESDKVVNERILYLREAYLNRWYHWYHDKYMQDLELPQLKALKPQIKNYERGGEKIQGFAEGKIKNDLDLAYKEMQLAVEKWSQEGKDSKSVYSNPNWNFDVFERWTINGKTERVAPLPDGTAFRNRPKSFPPTTREDFLASLTPQAQQQAQASAAPGAPAEAGRSGADVSGSTWADAVAEADRIEREKAAPAPTPGVTLEAAPEQQEPKVTDIKVEVRNNKPALVIEGTNLPQIAPIEMQLQNAFSTLKLGLISGVKDIVLPENLQTIDAHINAMIKNQLAAPSDNPQRLALAAYFGDLLSDSKISELKEKIFPPGSKPTLKIIGSSSFEGNLAYNQRLANDRAESAYRVLKASNPEIDRIYKIEKEGMVVGPEGEKVTDVNAAWNKLVELWNKNFNLEGDNALDLPKLKARIKSPDLSDLEKEYIATMFDENRGASVQVLPPADKPQAYNVEFRNLPTIPSAPAEGVPVSTPA